MCKHLSHTLLLSRRFAFMLAGMLYLVIQSHSLMAKPVTFPGDSLKIRSAPADPYLIKEYYVDGPGSLNIFTVAGNIELMSSQDSNKVRIELYVNHGFSIWPGGDNSDDYRITSFKRGNEITSSVENKRKGTTGFWSSKTTFSYKVYVPSAMSVNLKTLGGRISIQNVNGRQTLKSSGGDISLRDVKGHIEAYTSGGNIHIDESKGVLFARTDGGNIFINDSKGELRLKTAGGKISSQGISGSMIAKVGGGDITAQFNHVGQGINLQTGAGNIFLILPRSNGYKLEAQGTYVKLDQAGSFHGSYTHHSAEGTLDGGDIPIHLMTNVGTVTVKLKK